MRANATSLTSGTWTSVSALDFDMPQDTTGTNIALNGNAPANRTSLSHTITSLSIGNGTNFWIRWTNGSNNNGNYAGIDDLSVVVPEPASLALFSLGGLALVRRRR